MTEIRFAYDELRMHNFGSVNAFVRAFRLKVRELEGTNLNTGGIAIIDFIKKLTPPVRQYVQDNAPEGWFTDVKQAYSKTLNYELNKRAALQCDDVPRASSDVSPVSKFSKSYNKHDRAGGSLQWWPSQKAEDFCWQQGCGRLQ